MVALDAVLLTVVIAAAQPPQASPPAQPAPPPTALILGRVVDASSGRPIAGAIVTLIGGVVAQGFPSPGPGAGTQPRAMTNASGQFVFRKLPKGSFALTATKAGFAEGAYGRRRPGASLATLLVDAGQRVGDVVIPLWRHGSIAGTVVDEAGEPMIGVSLRAYLRRFLAGRRRLAQAATATTDDRGAYRFTGLLPGEYVVAFVAREVTIPSATAEALRTPSSNDPASQALMRERLALGSGPGAFPGTPVAMQVGGLVRQIDQFGPVPPAVADGGPVFIYPTLFYPAAPTAARAAVVTIASGQERDSVDFSLHPVRASTVSGTLIGPEGPAANVALRLVSASEDSQPEIEPAATMTGAAGEFTLLGVPAGPYVIKVLRVPRAAAPPPPAMTQVQVGSSMTITTSGSPVATPPPVTDEPTWFAETAVSVADADVTGVIVSLQRGARLTGRLEFDGTIERPEPAALARISIVAERADGATSGTPFTSIPPGRADESGTFKTYGLPPGRYLVRALAGPPGWTLKSVTSEGRDISDHPIDLRAADVANVVVTFTDRPTKLSGVARGSDGNVDPNALIVIFPADNTNWRDFGFNTRRMRGVRAGKDGTFSVSGLPAGDYYVAAIKEESYGQWQDPQVLEELSRGAAQIRLSDGETITQNLKTLGGGR